VRISTNCHIQAAEEAEGIRRNIYRNITIGEDVDRVNISTTRALFTVVDVDIGARTRDWSGQMSDESIQALCNSRRQGMQEQEEPSATAGSTPAFTGRGRIIGTIQ
jgi:hypothetical protein